MDLKKQLNKQAIVFSVIMSLSWLTYAAFMIVPEIVDKLNGRMNTLKYAVSEQLCVLVPTAILIVVFLILNYILKPDLERCFKVHVILGLVANLINLMLLSIYSILAFGTDVVIGAKLALFFLNSFWIVAVISILAEIVFFIKAGVHKQPKTMAVLSVSNAGICLLCTYIAEIMVMRSYI